MKLRLVPAVASVILSLGLLGQEPPKFGEEIEVNVVLIDAIVTDARGSQILGLGPSDFVVKENGVEQLIESVEYFTNRRLLTAREERAPFPVERVREDRYFVFFFDKPAEGEMFDRLQLARSGARQFVERHMQPGDFVAVVGHDVRLKVYSDFTNDKTKLKRALDEVARFGRGIMRPAVKEGPSILRNIDVDRMMDRTGTAYEALESVADALRPIRGRKNLILFSAGIIEPGEVVRGGMLIGESRFYTPMVRALNRANVAVYALSLWSQPNVEPVLHQTLTRLAADTSGDFFPFAVSYGPTLKRIEQTNNGYYLVSYRARHPKGTRGWQRVTVSVRNQPQLRVKARGGYVIP